MLKKGSVFMMISFWVLVFYGLSLGGDLPERGRVIKVLDGDTILLEQNIKVRYLGIDAPEIAHDDQPADCFGNEALLKNNELVLGKTVRLEYDNIKTDHHGRVLAYVYLEDGRMVNEILIKEGYAFVIRPHEFEKLEKFLKLQEEAIKLKKNMWASCEPKREPFYIGNKRTYIFHRPNCGYVKQMAPSNQIEIKTREDAFLKGFYPCRRCKP